MSPTTNLGLNTPNFDTSPWHDQVNDNFNAIDAILGEIVGITGMKGVWKNSTQVNASEIFADPTDGKLYQVVTSHVTAALPTTFAEDRAANAAYWQQLDVAEALSASATAEAAAIAAAASEAAAADSETAAANSADASAISAGEASASASTAQDAETNATAAANAASDSADAAAASAGSITLNAVLQGIAALGSVTANKLLYTTALNTFADATITAAALDLLDDNDSATQRSTLGLGTASVADLIDEDDMVSDSAAAVPSQQSVKAYVEAYVEAYVNANSGGGLVLVDSGIVSDEATVDIVWTNDGTYDGYIIEISQFVPMTDNVYIYCRTTADGTNFDSGASDYNYFMGIPGGAAALAGAAAAQGLMSWADTGSDTNENGVTMTAKVMHPEDAVYTMINATGAAVNSSGAVQALQGAIIRSSATACRGIRLFASSGNIESGKWRLYGLKA